ncbi:hypothetical protein ACX0G7_27090 [Flavitalea antarctica]
MAEIDTDNLLEIAELRARIKLSEEAEAYITSFPWCKKVINCWFDSGFYDKVAVFLFEIEPSASDVDQFIWVIVGDIPSVYIDSSDKTGIEALDSYCRLMNEWADNVMSSLPLTDCYPIDEPATKENAALLKTRIAFIQKEMLLHP